MSFSLFVFQSGTGKSPARIGEGPILTLERVERQQSGVYQCTADNNVGDPVTVDMRLDILCKWLLYIKNRYRTKNVNQLNSFK